MTLAWGIQRLLRAVGKKTGWMINLVVGLLLAGTTGLAHAHPHAFIDVQSTLRFSSAGMVMAIEEEWFFDELYTGFVIEDLANGKKVTPQVVNGFGARVIENLQPFDYFTTLTAGGKKVKLGTVTEYRSEMVGKRLRLHFTIPLPNPVDPVAAPTTLSVYDPTYFIEMRYTDAKSIRLRDAPAVCQAKLERAKPSESTIAQAFALDRNATPDETLGRLFADKVALACK
ncbi:DUF1007 family protein [Pigmentiphaga aceris]|uniref:DUF1007 family protein n=1 Tax=Pigmentiphaga aceris TaxID=1940612 RepID=A0A5C0ASF6_9BURK|nr:DUF1007 family protein [Pigmentiphaga aceris]QEI05138.1 DUF1007 family protein [Pigmentiphaga aceris]